MSDIQSVPFTEKKNPRESLAKWINANTVLQKILQRLDADDRSKLVLRCDEFPLIMGREEDYEAVFCSLMRMILQKKDEVPTLFLHISCTAEEQRPRKNGFPWFSIQFNTNIVPCTNWSQQNHDRLNQLAALLAQHGGQLVVHQPKASGCIFSVSVPGKAL